MIMCDVRVYASIPDAFARLLFVILAFSRSLQLQRKDRARDRLDKMKPRDTSNWTEALHVQVVRSIVHRGFQEGPITGNQGRYQSRIRHPPDKRPCRQHDHRHPCRIRHHPRLRQTCRYGGRARQRSSLLALLAIEDRRRPSASAKHLKPPKHDNVGSLMTRDGGRESPRFRA